MGISVRVFLSKKMVLQFYGSISFLQDLVLLGQNHEAQHVPTA